MKLIFRERSMEARCVERLVNTDGAPLHIQRHLAEERRVKEVTFALRPTPCIETSPPAGERTNTSLLHIIQKLEFTRSCAIFSPAPALSN